MAFNSLAPGGFENIFQNVFFKLISWIDTLSNSCETALRSMPQNPSDDKSTLVQVMAWCRQAASHYLSQCCPRSLSPYGVTRPQWVKLLPHYYDLARRKLHSAVPLHRRLLISSFDIFFDVILHKNLNKLSSYWWRSCDFTTMICLRLNWITYVPCVTIYCSTHKHMKDILYLKFSCQL